MLWLDDSSQSENGTCCWRGCLVGSSSHGLDRQPLNLEYLDQKSGGRAESAADIKLTALWFILIIVGHYN